HLPPRRPRPHPAPVRPPRPLFRSPRRQPSLLAPLRGCPPQRRPGSLYGSPPPRWLPRRSRPPLQLPHRLETPSPQRLRRSRRLADGLSPRLLRSPPPRPAAPPS